MSTLIHKNSVAILQTKIILNNFHADDTFWHEQTHVWNIKKPIDINNIMEISWILNEDKYWHIYHDLCGIISNNRNDSHLVCVM